MAALAANVLAVPVPQIGGEAQACQGLVNGVTNGVGQGTAAALNNVAGNVAGAKAATRRFRFFRRQGSGLAAACYDVVNNVDQGTGYAAQNIQAGAVGDTGDECTGDCAVGNARRQVADISNGVQAISNAAGAGQETAPVTGAVSSAGNEIDAAENAAGAVVGNYEADIPADTGAAIGNAIGSAVSGAKGSAPARRQLNKIAEGTQDVGDALGVGDEIAPITTAEDNIDGVGTGDVGAAGNQVGGAVQGALTQAGSSVP
ncbi:hypothetical protein M409DRAFT_22532 [Zasmidium cellare ATCC 36951]|uniref:Uncharacterized protein n=1 Tax=Zasmidium cellare ATCC 36951 TaxID=1080233 RepID=A0A6A6CLL6_ZASCE|nr:uncharacterized protein M409DRAFT_22532 [Zasmidium cellare ATCC 36951]KAF2167098.1 hypothetical protein M409DRAFT_22532 [Zasmidium cellare ATCC 36951]